IFALILWAEKRATIASEVFYWLAVVVVRTAATNVADLATSDLHLGFSLVGPVLTAQLAALLLIERFGGSSERDTSQWKLPATETAYWATLLTAGVLGTAAGDFVSHIVGLGLGSLILLILYGAVLSLSVLWGEMRPFWYWASIVAARTA